MSNTAAMTPTRAIVSSAPAAENHVPGANWHLQDVLRPSNAGEKEVLIEMAASGICHTDLLVTSNPDRDGGFPRVVGHEGSGYVKAIGPGVTKDVKIGDPVLLSFAHCGACHYCRRGQVNVCENFMPLNLVGEAHAFHSADGKEGIMGKFFGQSSFAKLSVVREESVLPAKHLIRNEEELKMFAPLGCGLQTGAGSVLNVAKATRDDSVAILGLGGVGLGALMAAKLTGCRQIIAIDRLPSRIDLAKSLGATDALDTTSISDLTASLKEVTGGIGPSVVIDTTGVKSVIEAAYNSLANHGALVFVGASNDVTAKLEIDIRMHMARGLKLLGCLEGDSVPSEFIPRLIEYYRAGEFPMEKFTKFYKVDDYESALHDMHSGETIKPVLVW